MTSSSSTKYFPHGVTLSQNQKTKLAKALERREPITIRLSHSELTGSDELMLTKTQIGRIRKSLSLGKGVDLKISKTQITKVVKKGGALWSGLMSQVLPQVFKWAPKIAAPLASGAMQALGSLGIDKLFGSGHAQRGGFLIPQGKIDKLIANKKYLTKKQKEDILAALQSGGDLVIKPTPRQRGGFLGSLLTTIGIPLLLNALTGKGLQNRKKGKGLQNRPSCKTGHGLQNRPYAEAYPYARFPPPFLGQWGEGPRRTRRGGTKKKTGKGILFGKNSPFNDIPLLGAIF